MKILYFSDNYTWDNWGTKRSIYEEVKHRGHNVIWLDKSQLKAGGPVGNHPIFQLCAEHNPDQIWLSHSNLQLPVEVKNKLNVPVIGFGFSDPYYFSEDRFTSYDAYITNHYDTLLKYRHMLPMHYNPTACDRNYHKKMDIEQDIDVSIIGRGEHLRFEDRYARIKIATMLRECGIRVAAFGDQWPEHPDNHGPITGDEFREVICRSKIGLDVQDTISPLAHRMLEYGACGIPVITRRRPEVFRLFNEDEILTYTSEQELSEQVKRLLDDVSQRAVWAEKLHNRCTQSHDIANRVDGILGFVESVFKKESAPPRPVTQQPQPVVSSIHEPKGEINVAKGIGNVTIGKGCNISKQAHIGYQEHGGSIQIGDRVRINHGAVLRTCTGTIKIGDRVSVAYHCIFHGQGGITIGNDVLISPGVSIYAQNHGISRDKKIREQKNTYKGVKIGDDVWIGANATILDGVTIGSGAVIGAGAVVTKNIPDYEIWAGNPAKKVSQRQTNYFQQASQEVEAGNMLTAQRYIQQYQASTDYEQLNPVFAESQKPKPLFSVVVVTYNRPEDVRLCIDSLRQQEFDDYEVIVVDNGDADKKAAALAGDVEVYVNCPMNFNPSEARNIGAHFAQGEILVFLDDDALVGPDYLVSIQEAFKQHEILGLRGKILPKNSQERSDRVTIYDLGEEPFPSLSTIEGNTAFRRDAYLAVGGMDALLFGHEGIDLSYRLMQWYDNPSAVIYWPPAVIYHDYGDANRFSEKESRYERNRNYLKYKYDVDVIGLKEKIQTASLKANQTGRLLPPFPVAQQPEITPSPAATVNVDAPKVSIVMSCHNAAQFLLETMDTILSQTLKEWELLVTDDGSTDATRQILETYAAKDQRIRLWFFDDKKGPYVRRNFAIEQAKAEFICIQDADDLMTANKLEILYEEICRDPRLGIVGSYYRRFLDAFQGPDFGDRMEKCILHSEMMEIFPRTWHLCWHGSAIIRKSLFEKIGLYDEQPYGSDTFWLSKAGLYGLLTGQVRFKNLPEFLTHKREHAQSQTGRISPADPRSRRHRLERYYLQKLQQISEEARANPSMDAAQRIRECTCTDFIPQFGHLFEQWESTPVNDTMIQGLINRGLSQFSSEQYVSALITLNCLDRMISGGCQSYRNLNFTRGLAYYAGGDDEQAVANIQKEIQLFQSQNARDFLTRYLGNANCNVSAADRRANIRHFVAEASQTRTSEVDFVPPQQDLADASSGLQEKLSQAKQYLRHGKSEEALHLYQGLLSDNMLDRHVELKEKLTKLVEGIRLAKTSQASSQTGFNFVSSGDNYSDPS